MNSPENIPKYVGKALDDLLTVIGTESTLKLRGKGGCVVKKVFDHEDLIKGAQLKDLKEGNMRQLIAQVQVTPTPKVAEETILTWELSYKLPATMETKTLQGTLEMQYTEDEKLVQPELQNYDVLVALRCLEAGELDKTVLKMLDEGRREEAILQKAIGVEMLKEVVTRDTTGFVKVLLERAEKHLADLRTNRDAKVIRKALDYDGYLGRRLSVCAVSEMALASSGESADAAATPLAPPTAFNTSPRRRRMS